MDNNHLNSFIGIVILLALGAIGFFITNAIHRVECQILQVEEDIAKTLDGYREDIAFLINKEPIVVSEGDLHGHEVLPPNKTR